MTPDCRSAKLDTYRQRARDGQPLHQDRDRYPVFNLPTSATEEMIDGGVGPKYLKIHLGQHDVAIYPLGTGTAESWAESGKKRGVELGVVDFPAMGPDGQVGYFATTTGFISKRAYGELFGRRYGMNSYCDTDLDGALEIYSYLIARSSEPLLGSIR